MFVFKHKTGINFSQIFYNDSNSEWNKVLTRPTCTNHSGFYGKEMELGM